MNNMKNKNLLNKEFDIEVILKGSKHITCLAYDGLLLYVSTIDGQIKGFILNSGRNVLKLQSKRFGFSWMSINKGSSYLYSLEENYGLYEWDILSQTIIREWKGYSRVYDACLSPDGKSIALAYDRLSLIDLNRNEVCKINKKELKSIVFSENSQYLVAGKQKIYIYDVNTLECKFKIRDNSGIVNFLKIEQCSIISGCTDMSLKVWNFQTRSQELSLFVRSPICCVEADNNYIVSSHRDKSIWISSRNTGNFIKSIEWHTSQVNNLILVNKNRLVSASTDGYLMSWNMERHLDCIIGHNSHVKIVRLSPTSLIFATACVNGAIKIWDSESKDLLDSYDCNIEDLRDMNFSPNGNLIAAVGRANQVVILDIQSKSMIKNMRLLSSLETVKFMNNEKIAMGGPDRNLILLEFYVDRFENIWLSDSIIAMDFYQSLSILGHMCGNVTLLENQSTSVVQAHNGRVSCVRIYADKFFTASWDHTIKIWGLEDRRIKGIFAGHSGVVYSIDIRDNVLVSCGFDRTILVWDIKKLRPFLRLAGHKNQVNCVQLSSGVISVSNDNTVKFWHLPLII